MRLGYLIPLSYLPAPTQLGIPAFRDFLNITSLDRVTSFFRISKYLEIQVKFIFPVLKALILRFHKKIQRLAATRAFLFGLLVWKRRCVD